MLWSLYLTPILGLLALACCINNEFTAIATKSLSLMVSITLLSCSFIVFIVHDSSINLFQFIQEYYDVSYYDFQMGVDGLSIYFILLTTIIIPISLVSNWKSIKKDIKSYVIILILLELLLLAVFFVLDLLFFYIYFESILPPLFILVGLFGSLNRVKASFYLFLYTLWGSLFLLLSVLGMLSIVGVVGFSTLFKANLLYLAQLFIFYGIFLAFAVKTPTIFLNTWLLKAHVESPLGGSIILAAIVLKLSLYGILRLILPILPKAYTEYTYMIFIIGVITIVYASLSTLRTLDIKELIAYSSVSHAAVYLSGVFSNCIQGIEGAINLGLAHGLVSPGLFISAGGVLYDRTSTRLISYYRGAAQLMPIFAILFFILCLANAGTPLTLNFVGEFGCLYGVFERIPFMGLLASSSIIFSAGYTMYMYQRIAFGGSFSKNIQSISDVTLREFSILTILVTITIILGIYPAPLFDLLHYSVSTLIFNSDIPSEVLYTLPIFGLSTSKIKSSLKLRGSVKKSEQYNILQSEIPGVTRLLGVLPLCCSYFDHIDLVLSLSEVLVWVFLSYIIAGFFFVLSLTVVFIFSRIGQLTKTIFFFIYSLVKELLWFIYKKWIAISIVFTTGYIMRKFILYTLTIDVLDGCYSWVSCAYWAIVSLSIWLSSLELPCLSGLSSLNWKEYTGWTKMSFDKLPSFLYTIFKDGWWKNLSISNIRDGIKLLINGQDKDLMIMEEREDILPVKDLSNDKQQNIYMMKGKEPEKLPNIDTRNDMLPYVSPDLPNPIEYIPTDYKDLLNGFSSDDEDTTTDSSSGNTDAAIGSSSGNKDVAQDSSCSDNKDVERGSSSGYVDPWIGSSSSSRNRGVGQSFSSATKNPAIDRSSTGKAQNNTQVITKIEQEVLNNRINAVSGRLHQIREEFHVLRKRLFDYPERRRALLSQQLFNGHLSVAGGYSEQWLTQQQNNIDQQLKALSEEKANAIQKISDLKKARNMYIQYRESLRRQLPSQN